MSAPQTVDATKCRATFEQLVGFVQREARGPEKLFATLRAEASDFVRFNHGRVRQIGRVTRCVATLRLIVEQRSASVQVTLAGEREQDEARLVAAAATLRELFRQAPADPYLLIDETPGTSESIEAAPLPDPQALITLLDSVGLAARGADLVGFYCGGPMVSALVSSLGHRHYHESSSWSFDYSLYVDRPDAPDKAVKSLVAGAQWSAERVLASLDAALRALPVLLRPVKRLAPGQYRAWLAPKAVGDLVEMLGWGGFSARAHLTGHSPLQDLRQGRQQLHRDFSLTDDLQRGQVPLFQSDGFVRSTRTGLITDGGFDDWLVSPRSAKEFAIAGNAAGAQESPEAPCLAGGTLQEGDALVRLGTGLAISNFWYLNFSDRQSCRVTGLTRFATLWVENGEPVAPVEVMRFDDSLFSVFGPALHALGNTTHWLPYTDTYDWRSFGGALMPGALVDPITFTL